MTKNKNMDEILQRYVSDLIQIYGRNLKTIILYGSYARGNFHENSDIDIMIFVNLSDEEIHQKEHELSDLTLVVAKENLAATEQSFSGNHYRVFNNWAYYAIFGLFTPALR